MFMIDSKNIIIDKAFREQQHPLAHRSEDGQPIRTHRFETATVVHQPITWPMYLVCAVAHMPAHISSPKLHSGSNVFPDSHPFRSKSIDPSILEIWSFQNLTLKIQSKDIGKIKWVQEPTHPFCSKSISFNSWDTFVSQFDLGSARSRS